MADLAELIRDRVSDGDRVAVRFEDDSWSWAEYSRGCATRAAYLLAELDRSVPPHVGVLLDNTPEMVMWLGAAALTGDVIVGINPTRRGAELARDITHTDCQLVVTEAGHRDLLEGLDLGAANGRVLDADTP